MLVLNKDNQKILMLNPAAGSCDSCGPEAEYLLTHECKNLQTDIVIAGLYVLYLNCTKRTHCVLYLNCTKRTHYEVPGEPKDKHKFVVCENKYQYLSLKKPVAMACFPYDRRCHCHWKKR